MNKSVLIIVGTRPEIIKTFPIVLRLEDVGIEYTWLFTGQHTDLATSITDSIGVYPDIEFSSEL